MTASAWHEACNRFHHKFLKNTLLGAHLASLAGVLGRPAPDLEVVQGHIEKDLPIWRNNRETAQRLIDTYVDETSPRVIVEQRLLAVLSRETRSWLGPLVHELWLVRESILERQDVMKTSLRHMNEAFEALMAAAEPAESMTSEDLEGLQPLCETLKERCGDLIHAFEDTRSAGNRVLVA